MMKKTEQNKKVNISLWWILPQVCLSVLVAVGMFFLCSLKGYERLEVLQKVILSTIGFGVFGYSIRKFFPILAHEELLSIKMLRRFWILTLVCMLLSFLCGFLPNSVWPILGIFVLLGLFGGTLPGVLGGCVLLMIPCLISGVSVAVFILYFICGLFGVVMFTPIREDVKIALPCTLSGICLLVCETAGMILTANRGLGIEQFLFPIVNVILSLLLIVFGYRYYARRIVYRYREHYMTINDSQHPKLLEMKENDKKGYMQSIHTAYFSEMIGAKLGLDAECLKCAALYHLCCPLETAARQEYYEKMQFPEAVRIVLEEYQTALRKNGRGAVVTPEAAVLLSSQTIILAMLNIFEKNPKAELDVNRIVDIVFAQFEKNGTFVNCRISISDYETMKEIFKRESFHYDLLRGE